jgi:hypothetical protein
MNLYSKSRPAAQAKTGDLLKPSLYEQHFFRNVRLCGESYACLRRELYANSHKYPGTTQSDLAKAWKHNRGEPTPTGRDAKKGGLANWLRGQGYVRRPGEHPGEFVWTKA